jgi:hypothetical protein
LLVIGKTISLGWKILLMPEESENTYSTDALNVLDQFYGVKYLIYVEGEDDIPFWSSLFDKSGVTDYYIDDVGGINNLRNVMLKIINEDAQVMVACDSGYSIWLDNLHIHQRIIKTYGYSIENTMYCPHIINYVIRKLSRKSKDLYTEIADWYKIFSDICKALIIFDLAREKYGKSFTVYGSNCCRYLRARHSYNIDASKVETYIN